MRKLPSFWRYLADNVPYCSFFLYHPLPYVLFLTLKISSLVLVRLFVSWFFLLYFNIQNLDFNNKDYLQ